MSDKPKPAKADRLAGALRANLKRRKAQARAQAQPEGDGAKPRPAAKRPKTGENSA
ncbi:MAG: hypothetical protein ACKVRO_13930 [Micropepsaceae bacterium]